MTAQKKRLAVRPLARVSPTHMEAEKNVKPIMMTNMDQKERFWESATQDCSKSPWVVAGALVLLICLCVLGSVWGRSGAPRDYARDVSGQISASIFSIWARESARRSTSPKRAGSRPGKRSASSSANVMPWLANWRFWRQ